MEKESPQKDWQPSSTDFHEQLVYLRKGMEIVVPDDEKPNVREFIPQKQEYTNPAELVQEFRNFIQNDIEEGEVFALRYKHAFQMSPETEKALNAQIQKTENQEEALALHDRTDIMDLLIKEVGVDLAILGGEVLL